MIDFLIINLLAAPFALLADFLLGEPKRFHPLVAFGNYAQWLETRMNTGKKAFMMGVLAWLLALMPIVLLIFFTQQFMSPFILFLFSVFCGWLAIGWNSLVEHGLSVSKALADDDIEHARLRTSYLVSRDTSELNESELSRATVESILENGNDAIIAALFWLCLSGATGLVLYRLSNTLDAMWGYRNERFEYFGKFTARIDDVLNYIPARLCALLYVLCGNTKKAFAAWKTQASTWYSPNAGVVMASGAGALDIKLGGSAIYHGKLKRRPDLGSGREAQAHDIKRAITLLKRSVYLLAMILISLAIIYLITINVQLF